MWTTVAINSLALSVTFAIAAPTTAQEWFKEQFYPKAGTDIRGELVCYGLPFGTLGFISHLLTLYSTLSVASGRTPLWPPHQLRHPIWTTLLNVGSMVLTVVMAGFTISSCKNAWPFVLLAVWKLMFGFMQSTASIIAAWVKSGKGERNSGFAALVAGFVYGLGVVVGAVGIFKVVNDEFRANSYIRIFTYVLIGIVAMTLILFSIWAVKILNFIPLLTALGLWCYLFMLYADWVLAAINKNWLGVPDESHKRLYWIYWAAKRLPMLSL